MGKRKRTEQDVLDDIVEVRAALAALPPRQKALYLEGHAMGIPMARMAAAGGPELAVTDQAVRNVIRRHEAAAADGTG